MTDFAFTPRATDDNGGVATRPQILQVLNPALTLYNKLIDAWECQESSGSFVGAKSGTVLAVTGGTRSTTSVNPALARSYQTTATSNRATIHSNMGITGVKPVAYSFWFKRNSGTLPTTPTLFGLHNSTSETVQYNTQGSVGLSSGNFKPYMAWEYGAGSDQICSAATAINIGDTNFWVFDRDVVAMKGRAWRDGVLDAEIDYTNQPEGGTDQYLSIGAIGPAFTSAAFGNFASCWMYSEALTPEEVAWLYNGGAGRTYTDLTTAAGV